MKRPPIDGLQARELWELGWSQAEIGDALGCTQSAVSAAMRRSGVAPGAGRKRRGLAPRTIARVLRWHMLGGRKPPVPPGKWARAVLWIEGGSCR